MDASLFFEKIEKYWEEEKKNNSKKSLLSRGLLSFLRQTRRGGKETNVNHEQAEVLLSANKYDAVMPKRQRYQAKVMTF